VSLKLILFLIVFTLLSVYFAFLNPQEVEFFLSQNTSVTVPAVILFLCGILLGVIIATIFNWRNQIVASMRRNSKAREQKQKEFRLKKSEQLFEKGKNALSGGQLAKAQSAFEDTLRESPNHVGALHLLGNIHYRDGHISKAIELHSLAATQAPSNLEVHYSLAKDYNSAALPVKELEVLKKLQTLDAKSARPLYDLRDYYMEKMDLVNAHGAQKSAIKLNNDKEEKNQASLRLAQISYINGMQHFEKANYETALSEFQRAIKESNICLPAHIYLGETHLKTGNTKAAIKAWKNGFTNTQSPVCILKIQQALKDNDDTSTLPKIYQDAVKEAKNSNREALVMLQGLLLLDTEDPDEAIKALEDENLSQSMIRSVLLANAYKEKQDVEQLGKVSQGALDIVRQSILQYTCSVCNTPLPEWQGQCPECKGWDTVRVTLAH
jgi:lipopolysaccharide biosynthesis regulator YciM